MIAQPMLLESVTPIQTAPALSRQQLVGGILELNPSATTEFLMDFSERALKRYLDHLTLTGEPRSNKSAWLREASTPAIVARENLD